LDLAVHICLNTKSQKNIQIYELCVGEVTRNTSPNIKVVETPLYWSNKFSLQSEEVSQGSIVATGTEIEAAVIESETVRFIDNAAGDTLVLPTTDNPVARVDDTDDLTLGRFFARPTLIHTASWSTADVTGNLGSSFDPWTLFLSSAAIRKKLDNFAYLRGNLHIKILVNGTPFQYGAVRYCYFPYASSGKIRTNTVSALPLLIPYSQVPGVFLHPQANAGGQMTLPFFYLKNWLDITTASEVATMGNIQPVVYAPLRLAVSGGSTAVTLRTYAWMTDVQLMGSTLKLSLQGDEYGDGPISLPASAIAAAAGALTKIPVIGRFARATEIGAGAISKMASLFGYTNVPVIADVHALVPNVAPHLASTQIGQPIQKLTVDPKQELSIDSSFHSLGSEDELAISYLKKKESYFGATSWSTTDAAGTQIFNMRINPNLDANIPILNSLSATVGHRSYQVPLSYFGRLFNYWRGDIRVRVKVVCTKFHKGRLKISYDPVADISATDPPENVVYTQILDIGEHDDVVFTIPYHQPEGWKSIDKNALGTNDNWTPGGALAPRSAFDNGTLTIRVLNTLTAPASSTVNLLFFVSGGDNFEYAAPSTTLQADSSRSYPTMFNLQGEDTTDIKATEMVIGTRADILPERYSVNMGECVSSLRSLLHRHTLYQTRAATDDATSGNRLMYTTFKRFPAVPGYNGTSPFSATNVVAAAGTSNFTFCRMTPLAWVTYAFCGYRGSYNWSLVLNSPASVGVDDISVMRTTSTSNTEILLTSAFTAGSGPAKLASYNGYNTPYVSKDDGMVGGGAITSNRVNNTIMINVPNYNKNNFARAIPLESLTGSTVDDTQSDSLFYKVVFNNSVTTNNVTLSMFVGAGPDFNPVFFLCCPTIDYLQASVTSS
jgi:hypothetical protein